MDYNINHKTYYQFSNNGQYWWVAEADIIGIGYLSGARKSRNYEQHITIWTRQHKTFTTHINNCCRQMALSFVVLLFVEQKR